MSSSRHKMTMLDDPFAEPVRKPVQTASSGIRHPEPKVPRFTLIDDVAEPVHPVKNALEDHNRSDRFFNPDRRYRQTQPVERFDIDIIPDSQTDTIRGAIAEMFPNFNVVKVENVQLNDKVFGIYKGIVDTMLANDTKYICLIVPNDARVSLGSARFVSQLNWASFQTRSTEFPAQEMKGYKLAPQPYVHPAKRSMLHDKIAVTSEKSDKWVYKPEHIPLTVELIKNVAHETFSKEGTILSALEMWRTVVTVV